MSSLGEKWNIYALLKPILFIHLALPSKPDELAKLVGECEALNLVELREMALEMLQKYQRTEEQHYVEEIVLYGRIKMFFR